jgi:hypothetical protein
MAETQQTTWRQATINLKPQIVNEFVFPDTKPNHVHINNLGAGELYFGVSVIPSPTIHDMKIGGYGENLYAQESGFTRVQIWNDGTDETLIKLVSFEHAFNPATIKPTVVSGGGVGGGGEGTTFDGVIKGFSVPLPSGANNIGRVVVSEMPNIDVVIDTLPAGVNQIGRVKVDTLPPLTEGVSHIGSVGIDGGVTISAMPPVTVSNEPVKSSHQTFEATVTTTEVVFDMGVESVNRIQFINNEGTTDLFISFDDVPATSAISSGLNKSFRLRAGEILEDMPRKSSKIRFIRATGSGVVRFVGV